MWSPSYTWYHGSHICWCGYQLPLISIKPIFENISSKAGQKITVACYQTCYSNWTKGSIHEVTGRTSSLLKYSCKMPNIVNIGQRWDTMHATETPQTTSLPSSRKFWYSLMVSNPSSHDRLFCFACFCILRTAYRLESSFTRIWWYSLKARRRKPLYLARI